MAGRSLAAVYVEVRGDTDRLAGDIEHGVRRVDTKGAGEKAGHAYGSAFAGGAKRIIAGIGGIAAAAGIGRVLAESVKGFREHQQVVAQTTAGIRSTGGAAKVSVAQVSAFADALERKTGIDGDVIQSSENVLLTFTKVRNEAGKGNDIFNQASVAALNLSVRMGGDVKGAALQMGKALQDPIAGVSALHRVGVDFDATQKKQIANFVKAGNVAGAQKIVLAELNKEVGNSAAAQGAALGAQGRLTVAWHQAQDTIGSALLPVVNELEDAMASRLPGAADKFAKAVTQANYGVQGFISAFHGEGITSTGFVGFMEKSGVAVRNLNAGLHEQGPIEGYTGRLNTLGLGVRALIAAYKEGDVTSDGFVGKMEQIGVALGRVRDYLKGVDFHRFAGDTREVGSSLAQVDVKGFAQSLQSIDTARIGDGFRVAGAGAKFLADHLDLLIKALPFLIAAYAAYQAAELAANVAAIGSLPIRAAQVVSNFALARSIKSLAAGNVTETVAAGSATGAELVKTAVLNVGTATTTRSTFATLAQATAQRVVAVATKAWTVAQVVLNAVLTANPIGLVIVAIAALAVGIIYAYKHSETFRAVVQAAFRAVADAGRFMWERVLRPTFAFIVGAWLTVAGAIVNGAAHAFGWVPGLGGKLKDAANKFNSFRDQVNSALSGVHSRKVTVTAVLATGGSVRTGSFAAATGGPIKGPGTTTSDSIPGWLSNDEHVWTAREVAGAGGHAQVAMMRKMAAAGKLPGFAAGGPVRFDVDPQLVGMPQFKAAIATFNKRTDEAARKSIPTFSTGTFTGSADVASVAIAVARALGRPGEAGSWARRIMFESGGNWNAVNRSDSNWLAGHPSVGGAQVIAGTFAANAGPYRNVGPFLYGVSVNPFANSYAGAHYAIGRYGSIAAVDPLVRPRGYDSGGYLPPGVSLAVNGTGRPERIRTGRQEDALLAALLRMEKRGGRAVSVTINNPPDRPTKRALHEELDRMVIMGRL